jgi:hypothetical protein
VDGCSEDLPGYLEHDRVRFRVDYEAADSPLVTLRKGSHIIVPLDRPIFGSDEVETYLGVGRVEAVLEVRSNLPAGMPEIPIAAVQITKPVLAAPTT